MTDKDQPTTTATASSPTQPETGVVSEPTKFPGSILPPTVESAEQPISTSPRRESTDIQKSSSSSPPLVQNSTSPAPQSPGSQVVPEYQTTTTATPDVNAEPRDPQVAALKAIFPDYDEAILQSVLESVNGNQDRAVDLLLGMSDPDFQSPTVPEPEPVRNPQMTQEQLDEELARRLMLEEQEQMTQWQIQRQTQEQQQGRRPHRSRSTRTQGDVQQQQSNPNAHSGQPGAQKDTMTEFQEQFSKIAESGKKTLGALVSKVKAKIQEFEKPGPSSGGQVDPNWRNSNAASASYYDPNPAQSPPRTNYQQYHHGSQSPPSTTTNTAVQQQQRPAFYDPNPPSVAQVTVPTVPSVAAAQNPFGGGYDATPLPPSTGAAPSTTNSTEKPRSTVLGSGAFTGNPSTSVPSSPPARGPSPANPIDGGKFGLLPKRPISLIRDPPPTQPSAQKKHSYDDDDLEYSESPFDDRK